MSFVRGLLDGIGMPAGTPYRAAYLNPPDPNVESEFPTAYILSSSGPESRNPKYAGTMSRNQGPGTSSGFKTIVHSVRAVIVYYLASDDPEGDILFAGIRDGIMARLRYSYPNPALMTDPYTGIVTQAANTGEDMVYAIYPPQATSNQRFNLWQGEITVPIIEVIQA